MIQAWAWVADLPDNMWVQASKEPRPDTVKGYFITEREVKMWMRRALIALIFMWLLIIASHSIAHAERLVNLNLVVVVHPDSPDPETQIQLFKDGMERLKEVGIKPRLLRIDIVPDFFYVNSLLEVYSRLYTWQQYGKKQHFKGIVFYSLPPMQKVYTAGQAGAICVFTRNYKKKFAEGSMKDFSSTGQDRRPQARVVVAHELLHLLGANHIDSKGFAVLPNVMHSNAQAYANASLLPIVRLTIRQVRWCKQGKNVLGKKR